MNSHLSKAENALTKQIRLGKQGDLSAQDLTEAVTEMLAYLQQLDKERKSEQ
jgi:hypothetical protein